MELLLLLIDLVANLDAYLAQAVSVFGVWTYLLLFLAVFCETGLVIASIIPSDSLLFVAGALGGVGLLNVVVLFFLFMMAAILGDSFNYWLGSVIGARAFDGRFRYLKPEHLAQARAFFDRHGGKAVILARFVPLMRTLVPFVSGSGAMAYGRFLTYNIVGSTVWVSTFLFAGYFFGSLPFVQDNFSLMLLVVVTLSFIPAGMEFLRSKLAASRQKAPEAP